jgi:CRP-like cAMP-binding protein
VERIQLLRTIPIFAPLPPAIIERLASELREVRATAGATIFAKGDEGDLFYVVDSGSVEIVGDDMPTVVLERGDFFGEIALLRDVPRTATARATTDATLYALGRDDFIPAVTGHAASSDAADRVIGLRLGPARAGLVRA